MATVPDDVLLQPGAFTGIVRAASDKIDRERPIIWDDLVPDVESPEEEAMVKFTGAAFAADIVGDDGEAVVHDGGGVTLVSGDIPNLKHGRHFSQQMIQRLRRLQQGRADRTDRDGFFNWRFRAADDLTFGIKQRRGYLKACMITDSIAYNRLGIKIVGTWGMPAVMKATSTIGWDTHGSATGVTDILTLKRAASLDNGAVLDGAIASSATWYHLYQQAEFIARIQGVVTFPVQSGSFSPQDPQMETFALRILGLKEIHVDDAQYKVREKDGSITTGRYVPVPRLTLFNIQARKNAAYWAFNNVVTSESIELAADGKAQEQSGPFGYETRPHDLNPPHRTLWAVQRGFPVKHDDYASAVLNTGTYTS